MRRSVLVMLLAIPFLLLGSAAVFADKPDPGGRIDPSLSPFLGDPSPVNVLVFLDDQPLWEIAQDVQATRLPEIQALEKQLRAPGYWSLVWFPDGKKLAFQSDITHVHRLLTSSDSGRHVKAATGIANPNPDPISWLADNKRVLVPLLKPPWRVGSSCR